MVVNDVHVHMGWWQTFSKTVDLKYYAPKQVLGFLDAAGIDEFCISSTSSQRPETTKGERLSEYHEMIALAGHRCHPLLWLNVQGLEQDPDLETWAPDDIPWCGLKLHNEASHWLLHPKSLERALSIAQERDWRIQFHTGGGRSDAGLYRGICGKFPGVKIDLAHGRPAAEAVAVARECPNVFLDCSFVSEDSIRAYAAIPEIRGRIMFGTDIPVVCDWYGPDLKAYVSQRTLLIHDVFGADAPRILVSNFLDFIVSQQTRGEPTCNS